jgi:hypothetical protein
MRNGNDFSPNGYKYHAYGEAQRKVEEWIGNFPEETDFDYNTIAEECDIQAPTVSSIVLKMARADPPTLARGNIAGAYRRITGVEPVIHTRRRGVARGTVRKAAAQEAPESNRGAYPVGDMMDIIGVIQGGRLLRAEDGTIWTAKKLEL